MNDFYNLSQTMQGALFGALYRVRTQQGVTPPPIHPMWQVQSGYAESPAWYMVQAAEFDPEPLTVAKLRVRDIYASERIAQAVMDLMTAAGWFDRLLADEYVLTATGREMMDALLGRVVEPITNLCMQLNSDLERLAALLQQVIDGWMADETRDNWCLAKSRNRAPAAKAVALLKINQFCSDFNAYRDDAHMAAFRGHAIAGIVWESFSYVHDGQAASAETLFSKLAHRGYGSAEFANGLQELTQRGWIVETESGQYAATETGREIRAAAERATDDYFYGSWLSAANSAELWTLMNQLKDELASVAPQAG